MENAEVSPAMSQDKTENGVPVAIRCSAGLAEASGAAPNLAK